jgi:predicted SAM-dependent methyltransferase
MSNLFDFSGTSIRTDRPLSSYTKIQMLKGWFHRNWSRVINPDRVQKLQLLNVGCGPNQKENYINLDWWWTPGIDICCDITQGLPIADASVEGIFTEHCLEHIPFEACQEVLKSFFRILTPGGRVRIAVPDAQIFVNLYTRAQNGETVTFPYHDEYPTYTPMMHMNRIFRDHGHLFAYDFETFSIHLKKAGFTEIKKCPFRQGEDPRLLIDVAHREVESMYIEAQKPR